MLTLESIALYTGYAALGAAAILIVVGLWWWALNGLWRQILATVQLGHLQMAIKHMHGPWKKQHEADESKWKEIKESEGYVRDELFKTPLKDTQNEDTPKQGQVESPEAKDK